MYEISVEKEFCAAHALVIGGVKEPVHGHNFHLTVTVAGESLGTDGMLVDFHALERAVESIIKPLANNDLNATPPLSRTGSPSAERIAEHIALAVTEQLPRLGASGRVRLAWVRLTEAPGCSVIYRP